MPAVGVVDYDPHWAKLFETLRSGILPVVADVAISIEHVGSTAVPGLPAKPVIDMDVVVLESNVRIAIKRLATLGYVHRGDLGIPHREAFHVPPGSPRHHLYLCTSNSLALRNHLVIRDCLRANSLIRDEYGELKRRLAEQHRDDIDSYIAAKTDFLLAILRDHGFTDDILGNIQPVNQRRAERSNGKALDTRKERVATPEEAGPYELLARLYDQGWSGFADRYVAFLSGLLRSRGSLGASILDLGCGTGTLAYALAAQGHRVQGIDKSTAMIEQALAKRSEATAPEFAVQGIEELSVEGPFDLVTCTFGTLNYLVEPEGVQVAFGRVRSVLAQEGQFVFDSNTSQLFEAHHRGTLERDLNGELVVQELDYDAQKGIATTVFRFPDGRKEHHRQRAYGLRELSKLLDAAGMVLAGQFANLQGRPFTEGDKRLVCVARQTG